MWAYWWLLLLAAGIAFGAGALIWLYTAIDLTRVVAPSKRWLARESQYNTCGIRLMVVGTALAAIGIALAIGHWLGG